MSLACSRWLRACLAWFKDMRQQARFTKQWYWRNLSTWHSGIASCNLAPSSHKHAAVKVGAICSAELPSINLCSCKASTTAQVFKLVGLLKLNRVKRCLHLCVKCCCKSDCRSLAGKWPIWQDRNKPRQKPQAMHEARNFLISQQVKF